MLSRISPSIRTATRILAIKPSSTTTGRIALRLTTATTTTTNPPHSLFTQPHSQSQRRSYASTPMAAPTDTQAESVANTTGITPDTLAQTLREKLDAAHVQIEDISGGCGASFTALIVSPQFQGKTLLARGRLVNSALKQEIAAIHAWTPRCLTPEQWEKEKEKGM